MRAYEVKFYYSEEEVKAFLEGIGYTIEIVKSWDNVTEYHNRVETVVRHVTIAYRDKRPEDVILHRDYRTIESECGMERMFTTELRMGMLRSASK